MAMQAIQTQRNKYKGRSNGSNLILMVQWWQ